MPTERQTGYKAYHLVDGVLCCDASGVDFFYEEGATYTEDGPICLCHNGFHFCEEPLDCWKFYSPASEKTVIGIITADRVSPDHQSWCSKRVCGTITIDPVMSSLKDYDPLVDMVKSRVTTSVHRNTLDTYCGYGDVKPEDKVVHGPHARVYDGILFGHVGDTAITTGTYSVVSNDDRVIHLGCTFGTSSVAESHYSFAFASTSLAVSPCSFGCAYTNECDSVAVAKQKASLAICAGARSRAVTNELLSVAVAHSEISRIFLNEKGSVGVTYGSATVTAPGCLVIVMPGIKQGERLDDWYYYSGTVSGPDGTVVMVLDVNKVEWLSVVLRAGDHKFPADTKISTQWLVEEAKRIKRKQDEDHS